MEEKRRRRNALSYPPYIEKLICDSCEAHTLTELTDMCNKADNSRTYTEQGLRKWMSTRGIKARHKTYFERPGSVLTQEQHDFFVAHNQGTSRKDLTEMLNKEFGVNITVEQVTAYRKNHHLPNGADTRFKKGNKTTILTEEGRKRCGKPTRFQKGNRPHSAVDVGTVVVRGGYPWIKVAEPRTWRVLGKVVWEQTHGKPFPKGMLLKYIDNDPMNVEPDNLIIMTRQEHIQLTRRGWTEKGTKTGATEKAIAKLETLAREKREQL